MNYAIPRERNIVTHRLRNAFPAKSVCISISLFDTSCAIYTVHLMGGTLTLTAMHRRIVAIYRQHLPHYLCPANACSTTTDQTPLMR